MNVVTLPVITQPREAGKKPSGCFLHLGIYWVSPVLTEQDAELLSVFICHRV